VRLRELRVVLRTGPGKGAVGGRTGPPV